MWLSKHFFNVNVTLRARPELFRYLGFAVSHQLPQVELHLSANKVYQAQEKFDAHLLQPAFLMIYSNFLSSGDHQTFKQADLAFPLLKILALPPDQHENTQMRQHQCSPVSFVPILPQTLHSIRIELRQADRALTKFAPAPAPTCVTLQIRRRERKK